MKRGLIGTVYVLSIILVVATSVLWILSEAKNPPSILLVDSSPTMRRRVNAWYGTIQVCTMRSERPLILHMDGDWQGTRSVGKGWDVAGFYFEREVMRDSIRTA
ncbi:MAG TPA: hypothetical protein VFE47_06140 [Tepidisphaeraceae bacterium]|jgi:hypothetical protein|nr:hypothetical protein [Tepidisphaeraceae bacterium]